MATLVHNVSGGPYPLPAAYGGGEIPFGGRVIIADTPANVTNVLKPAGSIVTVRLALVPDGQAGAIVPSSSGGGLTKGAASLFEVRAPVAANTNAVSSVGLAANSASNAFPLSGNPDVPRNLQYAFPASWDGGNIVVVGTNAQGNTITETAVAVANSTVVGSQAFATVTSAAKTAVGATSGVATIGTGNALGVAAQLANANAVMFADNAAEPATISTTNNTFTPTVSVPNGSVNYALVANL